MSLTVKPTTSNKSTKIFAAKGGTIL